MPKKRCYRNLILRGSPRTTSQSVRRTRFFHSPQDPGQTYAHQKRCYVIEDNLSFQNVAKQSQNTLPIRHQFYTSLL